MPVRMIKTIVIIPIHWTTACEVEIFNYFLCIIILYIERISTIFLLDKVSDIKRYIKFEIC
jgi:hypothetical protein